MSIVTITESATKELKTIWADQQLPEDAVLVLGVRGGGCSGFQYHLAFDEQREDDRVFESHGMRLLAEPAARGSVPVNVAAARLSVQHRSGDQPSSDQATSIGEPHLLNSETSILAFSARVLALAEDLRTPLAERLRFLSIVADGLDEFFMVRVAGIKRSALGQAEERLPDGLTPRQQLDLISLHARSIVARHYRCYHACAAEAHAVAG